MPLVSALFFREDGLKLEFGTMNSNWVHILFRRGRFSLGLGYQVPMFSTKMRNGKELWKGAVCVGIFDPPPPL